MFEVKAKKTTLIFFSLLIIMFLLIIFAVFLGIGVKGNDWLISIYISLPFVIIYILGIIDYLKYKLIIDSDKITVIKTFRKNKFICTKILSIIILFAIQYMLFLMMEKIFHQVVYT